MEARLDEATTLYDQKYCHDEKVDSLKESVKDVKLLFDFEGVASLPALLCAL